MIIQYYPLFSHGFIWGLLVLFLISLSGCQSWQVKSLDNPGVVQKTCPVMEQKVCAEALKTVEKTIEKPLKPESIRRKVIAVKPVKIAKDSYLYPYDMSQWLCQDFVDESKLNGTWWRIEKVLKIRPHQFYPQVGIRHLKTLPLKYAPKQRNRETFYYHKIHKAVYDDLVDLLDAADKAGFKLRVQSAFRSVERQNIFWQSELRKHQFDFEAAAYKVAPPCFSEHATGMAVDFSLTSIHTKISQSPVYSWLQKNAKTYGWRQSFERGKKAWLQRLKRWG